MSLVIDNETGQIDLLDSAVKALPRRGERIAAYEAKMQALLDPSNVPQPGGTCELCVSVRLEFMTSARDGIPHEATMTRLEIEQYCDGRSQIGA